MRLERGDSGNVFNVINVYHLSCAACCSKAPRHPRCSSLSRRSWRRTRTCGARCPSSTGPFQVAGISAPVDIVRDADAVPHIFASTKLDASTASATPTRRIACGRWSFSAASATAGCPKSSARRRSPTDRFLRTVGFGRAARAAWDAPAAGRDEPRSNAYVAGVNAFIATHHGSRLPPEFTLLRFEPEPWTGPDVLVWVKMMAWDLSANYSLELLRHDIAATRRRGSVRRAAAAVPGRRTEHPRAPRDMPLDEAAHGSCRAPTRRTSCGPSGLLPAAVLKRPRSPSLRGPSAVRRPLRCRGIGGALGSNNWVVDGTLTATGKPLLANDPHLGAQMPSLWYLAHMSAGDFDVIGATLPGAPAVAIGRNRFIAWGETNVIADVEDLYRERLDPTGTRAEFRGAQEPLRIVPETIVVKGAQPVQRRRAHHAARPARLRRHQRQQRRSRRRCQAPAPLEPLAFRWTALDATTRRSPRSCA